METVNYLMEVNNKSAKDFSRYGYSIVVKTEYGINCTLPFNKLDYLEYKYSLDKSICK